MRWMSWGRVLPPRLVSRHAPWNGGSRQVEGSSFGTRRWTTGVLMILGMVETAASGATDNLVEQGMRQANIIVVGHYVVKGTKNLYDAKVPGKVRVAEVLKGNGGQVKGKLYFDNRDAEGEGVLFIQPTHSGGLVLMIRPLEERERILQLMAASAISSPSLSMESPHVLPPPVPVDLGFTWRPSRDRLIVASVRPASPAAVGKFQPGDEIGKVEGVVVRDLRSLQDCVCRFQPGSMLQVEILRASTVIRLKLRI